jgi:carbon-monoxide dehydrogenase small subunit
MFDPAFDAVYWTFGTAAVQSVRQVKKSAKISENPWSSAMCFRLTPAKTAFTFDFDEFQGSSLLVDPGEEGEKPRFVFEAATSVASKSGGNPKMATVSMTVNGKSVTADIDPRTLLVQFIRENLRLTGTHVGCDTSQCGACVVHLDGKAVKACTMLALSADGANVTTIEGLAQNGKLHPMQEAFREHHGLQCGFCTPGMIMAAVDIVNRKGKSLDEHTIREELEGNICRCTGYHNIVKAVEAGAAAM